VATETWFPLAGRWLGFESADIVIDADSGSFTAQVLVPVRSPGCTAGGWPIRGCS